jgi:hypothetical protein
VYIGGTFNRIGDLFVNRIAFWDGTQWNALSQSSVVGLDSFVSALEWSPDGSRLYIGGFASFTLHSLSSAFVVWDGSSFINPTGTTIT